MLSAAAQAELVFTSDPPLNATEGTLYTYTMTAADVGDDDDDDDDNGIKFSVVQAPQWLAFDGQDTISGTPGAEHVGAVNFVALAVQSKDGFDEQSFTIAVAGAPNAAPQLVGEIPDPQSAVEGERFTLAAAQYFDDPDGDDLTFSASGLPGGLSISSEGTISGTPAAGTAGGSPYSVTVTASDGEASVGDAFTLNVTAANRAPVLEQPIEPDPQTAVEGGAYGLDAGASFSDPDGDALEFSAGGLPNGLSIDSGSGRIAGVPAPGTAGGSPYDVTVTASDGQGTAADSFQLNVTAANEAPVLERQIEPDPQEATEGERFSFDAAGFFADPNGDGLTFTASGLPAGLVMEERGRITGTPGAGTAGASPYEVTVTASDGDATASDSFTLNVTGSNEPPSLPDPPPLSTEEDTPLTITAEMLDAVDEDPTSLTVLLTPPAADDEFTLSGATVRPSQDFNGALTVEARVRDAEFTSDAVRVTITVTPVNDAPRIEAVPDQSATEGSPFTLNVAEYVSDAEGDPLDYRADGLPPGLAIDAVTGVISGAPAGTDDGGYDVRLTVGDGTADTQDEFTIAVLRAGNADLEATLTVAPNPVLIEETATWTMSVRNASEADVGNAALDALFSADTPFQLDAASDASCTIEQRNSGWAVSCRWAPLPGGESRTVEVTGSASQAGDIVAVATASITDAVPVDETDANDEARAVLHVTERLSSGPTQELAAPGAQAVAAADLDGDEREDLAVATGAGEPTLIFLNAPDPDDENRQAFTSTPISTGGASSATAIASADLDGDGDSDIVVANTDGPDQVLFNTGDASFEAVSLEGSDRPSQAVEIADVDGDGLADVVLAMEGANAVYLGRGGRDFALGHELGAEASADVVAVDLVGDALPELAFANSAVGATLYQLVDGAYALVATLDTGPATSVSAADFDGDGDADLVFGRGAADSELVFLNTSGSSASFFLSDELGGSATVDVLTADFDGDGQEDIVTINASGSHQLYTNSGAANTSFLLHPEQFASKAALDAAVGLFSTDARLDVAVAGADVVAVFFNDGRGNFGGGDAGAPVLTLIGEPTVTVTVGDEYVDAGATASDDLDGDLTEQIVVDNPVDTDVIGTYTVTYDVVDSSGNSAATVHRTVEVQARDASGGGGGGALAVESLLLVLLCGLCGAARLVRIHRSTP